MPGPRTAARVTLRPAGPGDAALLRHLFLASRDDLALVPPPLVDVQERAQRRQHEVDHPAARDRIVVADGFDAGRLLVDDLGDTLHVVDVCVLPQYRRRGVARAVLAHLIDEAGGRQVTLRVWSQNVAAIRLYEGLGFVTTSGDGPYLAMAHRTDG